MSLTSFIDTCPDVKQRFREEFKKPRMDPPPPLLAPPRTKAYSKVGVAFDYLLRFYLKRLNPQAVEKGHWVAEHAVKFLQPSRYQGMAHDILDDAKEQQVEYLRTGEITEPLLQSVLSLADLEPIYRAGRGHEYIGRPQDPENVEDLRCLIDIVPPEAFRVRKHCFLNPTFGDASHLVGGADADLILDDTLVDFKCVKRASFSQAHLNQLIGYTVLNTLSPVRGITTSVTLTHVAVYFARHAHMVRIRLDSVIDPVRFPSFVEWFQLRAKKEFGEQDAMKITRRENLIRAARVEASPPNK